MLRSCGVLVGVAVAFLALGLLLAAARDPAATAAARLARVTPGLVALACATLIIIMSAPESKPAAPPSGFPFTVPQTGLPIAQ